MKIFNIILTPLIVISLLFSGCSASKELKEVKNVAVEPLELHAWIDLMPGKPSTVHFSGVLKITNKSGQELKDLFIRKMEVFQNEKPLYSFEPRFSSGSGIGRSVLPGDSKLFKFNTDKGLKRKIELKTDDPVSAVLSFSSGYLYFVYKIDALEIQKVY